MSLHKLNCNWKNVTVGKFWKILAIVIATGLDKRPSMKDYWSTTALDNNSFYGNIMSRNRFDAIYHTMLHVGKMGAAGKAKIEPFLSKIVTKFQRAFYPFKSIAIDETVVGWKGSCKYKQYNAAKQKSHIRTFGLCVSVTGYVYNLLTYFDKNKQVFYFLMQLQGKQRKFSTLC